jgi:hypothetical protein
MRRLVLACLASALAFAPIAAKAEFLNPDLGKLVIEGVKDPDWVSGVRDGAFIGMCMSCETGTVMLQVGIGNDDGTGERVRSGETTAEKYTELGKANAAQLGGESAYIGTERIDFGSAVGFKTKAKIATGDFSATYQLWSDGKQLLVKVYGPDEAMVDTTAANAYKAAAELTFR